MIGTDHRYQTAGWQHHHSKILRHRKRRCHLRNKIPPDMTAWRSSAPNPYLSEHTDNIGCTDDFINRLPSSLGLLCKRGLFLVVDVPLADLQSMDPSSFCCFLSDYALRIFFCLTTTRRWQFHSRRNPPEYLNSWS